MQALVTFEWKGNVRELEAAIEHAALRAKGNDITPADLPEKFRGTDTRKAGRSANDLYTDLPSLDELQKRYLQYVLEKVGNNRSRAAEVLGVDRRTLYRMAERFELDLSD